MIHHQDNAPTHASAKILGFIDESKINYVKPEEWMPKSADAAPMEYAVSGFLTRRSNKHIIETLGRLKNIFVSVKVARSNLYTQSFSELAKPSFSYLYSSWLSY